MDLYLKEKTAVITGASQGIGKSIAIELAREGVQVFAVGRNQQLLQALKDDVKSINGVVPLTFAQDIVATDGVQNKNLVGGAKRILFSGRRKVHMLSVPGINLTGSRVNLSKVPYSKGSEFMWKIV